jgi:hypothetical protein
VRLLRHPSAHRSVGGASGGHELAASPDTPRPQASWMWDLYLLPAGPTECRATPHGPVSVVDEHLTEPGGSVLSVRWDAAAVHAELGTLTLDGREPRRRPESELWVLVASAGAFREGSRTVPAGAALICEGDDPLTLDLAPVTPSPTTVHLLRISRTDGSVLRWVP